MSPATGAGRDFVARFADAWAEPDLGRHEALWHPSVRLVQPMAKTTVGWTESRAQFSRIFRLLPDLRANVQSWSATDDLVFIEIVLSGTLAGRRVEWTAVDRFYLLDGLIAERTSYFDSMPLALAILMRPKSWPSWIRSRLWAVHACRRVQ